MSFDFPALPYAIDALEPYISARTLQLHYGRHHRGYIEKLERLLGGAITELGLEDLVRESGGAIFENAAQAWNHTFYWNSMTPRGGGAADGPLGDVLVDAFGSHEAFRDEFVRTATGLFGSGYVWLTVDSNGKSIAIEPMKDAGNPLVFDRVPLLTLDVWEHAYYVDYQNVRKTYVETFIDHLANWEFANANLEKAR